MYAEPTSIHARPDLRDLYDAPRKVPAWRRQVDGLRTFLRALTGCSSSGDCGSPFVHLALGCSPATVTLASYRNSSPGAVRFVLLERHRLMLVNPGPSCLVRLFSSIYALAACGSMK